MTKQFPTQAQVVIIEGGVDADFINAGSYEIEVACQRFSATASLKPFYDPQSLRIKS